VANKVITWLVVGLAAGVVTGCEATAQRTTTEEGGESNYPPVDSDQKYFKPGPVLATPDDNELAFRFDYHKKVIDAHKFSYTISETAASHMELHHLTGLVIPADSGAKKPPKALQSYKGANLPDKWDSREHGAGITPIRNQGQCGSCWAFGTTAAVEASIAKADGILVDLSEQQILSCSGEGTCNGGFWAYEQFIKPGGAL